jgi:thymidylate synthase (FAD)
MTVKLIWKTPDAEKLLAYIARVSNPDNQDNPNISKLLKYMADNSHWSPFEMVNLCVEINTTRDIARQILRHRSFSFQEFSQRYQTVDKLGDMVYRECRLQDTKNRQNSLPCDDAIKTHVWNAAQKDVYDLAIDAYNDMLDRGIAKEVARALLPEGLTPSRMYVNGNLRSWIHYVQVRTDPTTQKEHRLIAEEVKQLMIREFPVISEVLEWSDEPVRSG